MDLEYLLWLQGFREATGNILTPLMDAVSVLATSIMVLVPLFVYWCISRRNGLFMLLSLRISALINSLCKLTVCAYRPWIRDARIIPAEGAVATAGGYSFPSGHTMEAAPVYGSMAVLARKRAKWFSWLCGIMIILTALSRNYLGVHTPQDVVVGSVLGIVSVYAASRILAHPEKENIYLIAGIVVSILAITYFSTKTYPMDYVNGKLLVDPVKMKRSGYGTSGAMIAFILGYIVEKKYVNFTETGFNVKGLILSLIGIAIYGYGLAYLKVKMPEILGSSGGRFAAEFITMFFGMAVWPAVLKVFANRKA
ncbi:MAG: phosphatase PAP2 family protein [Synergistaceae bacterium]|nr:phosphatase PAP2 family protein [Synergistaceae bacterium]